MSENDIETWSWSKLNSFNAGLTGEGCLYGWYLTYREGNRGEGNFFGEYGSLAHDIIERYNKNEIFDWDVESELEKGLLELNYKAPFARMEKSYMDAIRLFFNGDGLCDEGLSERFTKYKFLDSELEVIFDIDDIKIKGYVDAIVEHEEHGFCIMDYKSSKPYTGDKLKNNIMQLYLYSIGVKNKYGKYPDNLIYYYFKENTKREYVYKFDLKELERTIQFVKDIVVKVNTYVNKEQFDIRCLREDIKKGDFYSCQLCNHRNNCEYKK